MSQLSQKYLDLYYISPAEAKATITELFTTVGTNQNFIPIQVTEEKTTRSIIVRGKEKDLDIVDKVIREIDKRTQQVLIEAFIVEATSSFEKALGKKMGAAYTRNGERVGGTHRRKFCWCTFWNWSGNI